MDDAISGELKRDLDSFLGLIAFQHVACTVGSLDECLEFVKLTMDAWRERGMLTVNVFSDDLQPQVLALMEAMANETQEILSANIIAAAASGEPGDEEPQGDPG